MQMTAARAAPWQERFDAARAALVRSIGGIILSVKANVGHSEPAAGNSGLFALALHLEHSRTMPNAQLRNLKCVKGGLAPATWYAFRVTARGDKGDGPSGPQFIMRQDLA